MTKAVLGIVGGSGIYDLPGLEKVRQKKIKSPWGEPSAALRMGEIAGTPVVFLSRHDKGHRVSPSDINYRANINVLNTAGVTDFVLRSASPLGPTSFACLLADASTMSCRPALYFSVISSPAEPPTAQPRSSARA